MANGAVVIRARLARWLHGLAYRLSPPQPAPVLVHADAFADASPLRREQQARAIVARLTKDLN
jgi:hypothetical protein